MFYVYILHSLEDHGLYIGFSTNLKKRKKFPARRAIRGPIDAATLSAEGAFTWLPRMDSNHE